MKIPIYREDDEEFLGYIVKDSTSWKVQTIFGYTVARAENKQEAEKTLRDQGLGLLLGVWNYYDKDDRDWFPCVIQEAYEHKVIVQRTNAMGYIDPDDFKRVIIKDPDENVLVKSS